MFLNILFTSFTYISTLLYRFNAGPMININFIHINLLNLSDTNFIDLLINKKKETKISYKKKRKFTLPNEFAYFFLKF